MTKAASVSHLQVPVPKTVLIDKRNAAVQIPRLKALIARSKFTGFDLETEDSRRHDGLNRFCKYDPDGYKSKGSKLVFDFRRTTICGASFYSEEQPDEAYYINFGHADVENRLPVSLLLELIECRQPGAHFVAHNSAFEQTVIKACLGYDFPPGSIICTMTQAVSAYGPDTYAHASWIACGQGAIGDLVKELIRHSEGFDPTTGEMSPRLNELVFKIIGKQSKAEFSWNGFVKAIAFGYGLKQAVLSHFNYRMTSFEETLDGEAHMGLVTGEQVADYGADDAFWALRLFRHLLVYMLQNGGPALVTTFFEQENPMPKVFSEIALGGMRVNHAAILERTKHERAEAARILRELRTAMRQLSWAEEPNERLLKYDASYYGLKKDLSWGWQAHRAKVQDWIDQENVEPREDTPEREGLSQEDADFEQMIQARTAVTVGWASERGWSDAETKRLKGLNPTYYMATRMILFDLVQAPVVLSKGKVASDGEGRGRVVDGLKDGRKLPPETLAEAFAGVLQGLDQRIAAGGDDALVAQTVREDRVAQFTRIHQAFGAETEPSREDCEPFAVYHHRHRLKVIDCLNKLAGVEQRIKLYLTPYNMLVDPETGCMYPSVTSLLATRRMACSNPNAMQLGKRGESAYIRGFFIGDFDDHMIISLDWSGVELVEIGEFSGDPEFFRAFGQVPHLDLHAGTATALLALDCPGMNLELFKSLKTMTSWNEWLSEHHGEAERLPRLMTNLKGELIASNKAYGYWRTVFGKEANFNYFYSGWLATIGERAGWSQKKTADATDAYRAQFPIAEEWRVRTIQETAMNGFLLLPDGHRYTRYEATAMWSAEWCDKFLINVVGAEGYNHVIRWIMRKIQKRAGNQAVNAYIQGTCATLAKRSIIRTILYFRGLGWTDREFRFLVPIHDELVWSVHQDYAVEFIRHAHRIMIDHGDIFKRCKLDSSPAIGCTFEPWAADKPKTHGGQVELFEPPELVVGKERAGKRLDDQGILDVVEYLKDQRIQMQRAA
jgi:DNA polymerase I-like protein with 3'-5' exonuclease and polymerase domains